MRRDGIFGNGWLLCSSLRKGLTSPMNVLPARSKEIILDDGARIDVCGKQEHNDTFDETVESDKESVSKQKKGTLGSCLRYYYDNVLGRQSTNSNREDRCRNTVRNRSLHPRSVPVGYFIV